MKKRLLFFALLVVSLGISSCNNNDVEKPIDENNTNNSATVEDGEQDRVDNDNNGKPALNEKSTSPVTTKSTSQIPPLTVGMKYITEIRSYDLNGSSSLATDIVYDEARQLAFIAYASKDENNTSTDAVYGGAIDVLDLSDANNPTLKKTITGLANFDFYSLALSPDGGKLYVAGAADVDALNADKNKQNDINSSAIVLRFSVNEILNSSNINYKIIDAPGFAAKDVVVNNNTVTVITGNEGYLAQYNTSNLELTNNIFVGDGRAVEELADGSFYALTGTKITKYTADLTEQNTSAVNMDNKAGAQRYLSLYNNAPIAALGANGVSIFTNELSEVKNIPTTKNNTSIGNVDEEANAAAVAGDYLLIAEGANGVIAHRIMNWETGETITAGGVILNGSPNNIIVVGKRVFVASGEAGITVLEYINFESADSGFASFESGTNYTESTEIDFTQSLLLPEGNILGLLSTSGLYTVNGNTTWRGILSFNNDLTISETGKLNSSSYFTAPSVMNNGTFESSGYTEVKGYLTNNGSTTVNTYKNDGELYVHGNLNNTKGKFYSYVPSVTINGSFLSVPSSGIEPENYFYNNNGLLNLNINNTDNQSNSIIGGKLTVGSSSTQVNMTVQKNLNLQNGGNINMLASLLNFNVTGRYVNGGSSFITTKNTDANLTFGENLIMGDDVDGTSKGWSCLVVDAKKAVNLNVAGGIRGLEFSNENGGTTASRGHEITVNSGSNINIQVAEGIRGSVYFEVYKNWEKSGTGHVNVNIQNGYNCDYNSHFTLYTDKGDVNPTIGGGVYISPNEYHNYSEPFTFSTRSYGGNLNLQVEGDFTSEMPIKVDLTATAKSNTNISGNISWLNGIKFFAEGKDVVFNVGGNMLITPISAAKELSFNYSTLVFNVGKTLTLRAGSNLTFKGTSATSNGTVKVGENMILTEGSNSSITVNGNSEVNIEIAGTFQADSAWEIHLNAGDKLSIKATEFKGYAPKIIGTTTLTWEDIKQVITK